MFINTKKEAQIAQTIAHNAGFTSLSIEKFYKRETVNVFAPWSNDSDARAAQSEIASAIRANRAAKRRPTKQEIAAEEKANRDLVAHNISARTGETYNEVLKRV